MEIKQLPEGPYDHGQHEDKVLEYWLESKFYKPETAREVLFKQGRSDVTNGTEEKFTIIDPPPNAYARPHMGNVSGYALQDLFGRRARMDGKVTLLLPGKDHAAQQAEIIYIKDILTPQGKKKSDYSRDEFYANAYEHFTGIMKIAQDDEKRVGLSADFDRDIFTLDPRVAASVYSTFRQMWQDKLVYKGVRIVNWSPGLNSAVADIDTERKTVDSIFYYIKYPLPQVDQDILSAHGTFKDGTFSGEIIEQVVVENADVKKLEKQSEYRLYKVKLAKPDTEMGVWIAGNFEAGHKWSGEILGLTIPLTSEVNLIAAKADERELAPKDFEYIFKASNALDGSSFIKQFAQDDDHIENDYARGFIIATVRPETKFGDTAIAVNPDDERYAELVEKEMELISYNGVVKIRVIADTSVEKEFGTGVLKVTPAHAPTDYDIYLRYNQAHPESPIGYKNVIEKDGKLNHIAGALAGMHAEHDRAAIAEKMKEKGLIVWEEPTTSNITICERTKTIIQPIMSSQWFIDTDRLKVPAIEAVNEGKVNIYPDYMTKKLASWLENLRDWPISRSIWWGYRLPVWYMGEVSEITDENGQLQVHIGDTAVADMNDAIEKGMMKLMMDDFFRPILVPGRFAPENSTMYARLKEKYPWAQIVETGSIDQTLEDYINAFKSIEFNEKSIVVAHSLGAPAVMDYLLNNSIKIAKLILLSPSNSASPNTDHYKQNGFWKNESYAGLSKLVPEISVIYSDDDEHYKPEDFDKFIKEQLPENAKLILEKGKQHFSTLKYSHDSEELNRLLEESYQAAKADYDKQLAQLQKDGWIQDEDVFDTWFSSGQWPYATLEATGLMSHYPTSVMETGFDILELWVSRMLMLGLYTQGKVPFENVYLHGLIKAEDGQKMSKSKGNVVYTQDIINEHGADTLRMFYIVGKKAGASYRVDPREIKGYRNFLNKIWNVTRFSLFNLENELTPEFFESVKQEFTKLKGLEIDTNIKDLEDYKLIKKDVVREELQKLESDNTSELAYVDQSMLKSLQKLIAQVNDHLDNFRPGMAAEEIIQHFWHVFADIYVEQAKTRLFLKDKEGNAINRSEAEQKLRATALATTLYSLVQYLKLLHPFIPFITETIWQILPEQFKDSETIMYASWPK
jgi:valyl-tRNA synthetase